jgi:hypothetical protein
MKKGLNFCLQAATTLTEDDLETITDAVANYKAAGMQVELAETRAVDDAIAQVTREREAIIALARAQYPELFGLAGKVDAAANQAATSPTNDLPDPTPAQKEAGNYKMGHTSVHGLDITIENPKGSERRAIDNSWVVPSMPAHYGYIKRTEGADGDHVDVFIGPKPDHPVAWVINQKNPDGTFDEHKVMLGFTTGPEAKAAYLASFSDGWGGKVFESISAAMDIAGLKATLPRLEKAKPVVRPSSPEGRAAPIIQRKLLAADKFIESTMEQFGLTKEEAGRALDYMLKNRLMTLDSGVGQFKLKSGAYWDRVPMRRAAGLPDEAPPMNADLDDAALLADSDFKDALGDLGDIVGKNFRASLTPEQRQKLLPVMARLFDAAFRKGLVEFRRAARAVMAAIRAALGPEVADEISIDDLQAGYIMASQGKTGATPKRDVVSIETKEELEAPDVPSSGSDLERDSGDAGAGDAAVEGDLPGDGSGAGARVAGTPAGSRRSGPDDNPGFPAGGALAAGKRGDQPVPAGDRSGQLALSAPGDSDSLGGGRPGGDGILADRETGSKPADAARRELAALEKAARQKAAQSVKIVPGSLANIRESLPFLLDGQQEDVLIAETRFAKPDGYGMLFANGTGTGKTYMGLGILKRLERQGKTNILIVAPDDKIMADWVKSAKSLLLDIAPLANKKDAGRGIVITTYANLQDNDTLATRDWDAVVADEAHKLVQNKDGEVTRALRKFRAITLHPDGKYERHSMLYRDDIAEMASIEKTIAFNDRIASAADTMEAERMKLRAENAKLRPRLDALRTKILDTQKEVYADVEARQLERRPRALFLSATPFAWVKALDWAEGYLFDYREGYPHTETSLGYNTPSPQQYFFQTHFGYQMKTGKLNQPDAKVDSGAMERQFNTWMKKRGVLSNRTLDVDADYDRRFILAESAVGTEIDRALQWVTEQADASKPENTLAKGFELLNADLTESLFGKLGHLTRRYLLEAIKAKEVIPHIRAHLALGRKVVVFHDFKKGGAVNPFNFTPRRQIADWPDHTAAELSEYNATVELFNQAADAFRAEFPMLAGDDILSELQSPIERFSREFEDVLLINGSEKKEDVLARYNRFNDDAVGPIVALVQSDKNAGWSGHDTTGKHQRVLFNLGLPTQPTKTIQTEGRIYRTGQVSNAIMRYLNTGTNWERWAFAETIATRAATVDNLASGEAARALKDAFIAGFEESGDFPAGHDGEGTGGKARDKMLDNVATLFDRAVAFYWGTQKKNSRTKAQEGKDYFATPEPLGLKMVEWADIRPGEDVLEPSAGHGAIARWFPDSAVRTAIEPEMGLGSRMALVFDGKVVRSTFEDLHVVNKYDAIVMNPPFGTAGRTAVDHIIKAVTHLHDGGRIVALIPTGPAADKKFDAWFYEEETRPAKPIATHPKLGPIYRGDTVTINGFGVTRSIIVGEIDGAGAGPRYVRAAGANIDSGINWSAVTAIEPTGARTETFRPTEGLSLVADIKLPSVTFERAGTQVATRIVIIDKGAAPGQVTRDYTGETDIKAFFERIRDADIPARSKKNAPADAPATSAQAPQADAAPEATYSGPEEMVEHTTGKGKLLKGVVRTGITKAEAQQIDKFTFPKNGGWFIRLKHLNGDAAFSRADARSNAVMPREATTFEEAREAARGFVGRAMRNAATGETATVSNATLAKMLSGSSASKSTSSQDHAQAVANADVLFERSLLDSSSPDVRGEPTIAAIQRFVAPMVTADGSVVAVKLTVKKTVSPLQPNPLYTIETIDVQKPALGAPLSGIEREPGQNRNSPQAGFSESVQQLLQDAQAAQDGPMSRAQPGMGSAIRDVNRVADRVRKVFPNAPGINVLPSSQYAPADLREFMAAEGMLNEADGVYWGGEVWVFANKIASPARAEWVMLHEFGHAGMRALFPMEIERRAKFATMLATNPDLQARVARLMEARPEVQDMVDAVDEVLADAAASGERPNWLMDIVAWIRAQLRRAGLVNSYSDNDVLAIVAMGRRRLQSRARGSMAGAFSRRPAKKLREATDAENEALEEFGLTVESKVDAAQAFNAGDAVFVMHDQDDMPSLVLSATVLDKYTADQMMVLPAAQWPQDRDGKPDESGEVRTQSGPTQLDPMFSRDGLGAGFDETVSAEGGEGNFSRAGTGQVAASPARLAPAGIVDAALRIPMQALGVDRLTRNAGRALTDMLAKFIPEKVKAGVVDDFGLGEVYIDRRALMYGQQRKGLREAKNFYDRIATVSREEAAVLYSAANNADAEQVEAMIKNLSPEGQAVLREVKQRVQDMGREQVRLGLLSADAFERNEWAYLRRSYRKYEQAQTEKVRARRGRAIQVWGDAYIGRGLFDPVAPSKLQGRDWFGTKSKDGQADKQIVGQQFIRLERRKPSGEGVKNLPGIEGKKAPGKLLEAVYWKVGEPIPSQYVGFEQAGVWEARDTKGGKVVMWRDFTPEERVKMGEIDDFRYAMLKTMHFATHNVEVGRFLEWTADTQAVPDEDRLPPGAEVREANESLSVTYGRDVWVQVPSSKAGQSEASKYGKLAGQFVPGPVWNDLRQIVRTQHIQPFGELYADVLRFWKVSKTALSPVVHMNNVVSNIVMADWHDVTARDIITGLRTFLRRDTDAAAKTAFDDFEDAGGTQGLYVLSEIQKDQLEPLLAQIEAQLDEAGEARGTVGVLAALQFAMSGRLSDALAAATSSKPGKGAQKVGKLMMDMYEAEDTVFRFAAYLKAIEQGMTAQEAGKIARRSFLDYSINAPWIQLMRNTAFPFVSFVYRAIPMLWDVAQNKPWKLAKLALMIGAANALGYAMSGGDEDRERALLPEELSGRVLGVVAPKLVRMPWNDRHGSPVYLDIRRWIPVGDIVDTGATNSAFPILPAMLPGGPLMMLGELLLNQSAFTGREITKQSDTVTEQGIKVADYLYKAFAPNLPGLPNTWSTESIANAATGKTDVFGREQASVGSAVMGAVGIKARSYPVDTLAYQAQVRFAGQSREINAEIRSLARQASRKGISPEDFEEGRADALEKLRDLEAKLRARLEAAQL